VAETVFLRQFIANMPSSVATIISNSIVNLTDSFDDKNSNAFFLAVREAYSSVDCVAFEKSGMGALPFRNHFEHLLRSHNFGSADKCSCFLATGNSYNLCLDDLCNLPPECQFTVYDNGELLALLDAHADDLCLYLSHFENSEPVRCVEERGCNWNPQLRSEGSLKLSVFFCVFSVLFILCVFSVFCVFSQCIFLCVFSVYSFLCILSVFVFVYSRYYSF
jgi:hypothetical protein